MALPGMTGVDHIGFTVPDLAQARTFLVDVLGCEYLYSLGPFVHEDSDWMAEHLNVHPRTVMRRNSFFRCGGQAIFEVFSYEAPDQNLVPPRNSDVGGHHVALYVDDLDAAVGLPARAGRTGARRADGQQRGARGSAVGLLPQPLGDAVRAGQLPRRQGVLLEPRGVRMTDLGAASERIAASLREAILSGEIAPGQWIRQEEVAARLGASRLPVREALRMLEAEGLTEHEANKGSRVPLLDRHEVDVVYQMRERLEPLALSESLPHLTAGPDRAPGARPGTHRGRRAADRVPRAGPGVPPDVLHRVPVRAAGRDGQPAVERHAAPPPGVHAAGRSRPALGGQQRAPAAARRHPAARTRSTASATCPGTSAAPGSSSPSTPRPFPEAAHDRVRRAAGQRRRHRDQRAPRHPAAHRAARRPRPTNSTCPWTGSGCGPRTPSPARRPSR